MVSNEIRTKKTKDGRLVRYPLRAPGFSKQEAQEIAESLHRAYPEEAVFVKQIGGKRSDLFAPFISYVGERISARIPAGAGEAARERRVDTAEDKGWFDQLPSITYKVLADQITGGGVIYAAMNGESEDYDRNGEPMKIGGDAVLVGVSPSGLAYTIEWPHANMGPEPLVGEYRDGRERVLYSQPEMIALRTKVRNTLERVKENQNFLADLRDNEAEKILSGLEKMPASPNELMGIRYADGVLTIYPVTTAGDLISVHLDERDRKKAIHEVNTFATLGALEGFMRMFTNSGATQMIVGIGANTPIYGNLRLKPDEPSDNDGTAPQKRRELGQLSMVVPLPDGKTATELIALERR